MSKCVAIEMGDDGTVKVGMLPPEAAAQYAQGMQPAQDVAQALDMAKQILAAPAEGGETGEMGPAMAPGGGQMMGKMSPQDQAWNKVSADRKMMS